MLIRSTYSTSHQASSTSRTSCAVAVEQRALNHGTRIWQVKRRKPKQRLQRNFASDITIKAQQASTKRSTSHCIPYHYLPTLDTFPPQLPAPPAPIHVITPREHAATTHRTRPARTKNPSHVYTHVPAFENKTPELPYSHPCI